MSRTYSPKNVSVSFNGYELQGFAEDEFITATHTNDQASMVVGNDGTVSRAINPDQSGTITLTLKQTSPSNDILSGLAVKDRLQGGVVGALLIRDNFGTTLVAGKDAWIKKTSDVTFGREVGNRVWAFDVGTLLIFAGSNPED